MAKAIVIVFVILITGINAGAMHVDVCVKMYHLLNLLILVGKQEFRIIHVLCLAFDYRLIEIADKH